MARFLHFAGIKFRGRSQKLQNLQNLVPLKYQISFNVWIIRLSKEVLYKKEYNKVDSIETGCIVIAHLFPWSDVEKCMYGALL